MGIFRLPVGIALEIRKTRTGWIITVRIIYRY